MWGQLHPWERAGVAYDDWYQMLRQVTQAHVAADDALRELFPDDERLVTNFTFEEFRERSEVAKRRQQDFWDAINGDDARILDLMDEYRDASGPTTRT